MERLDFFQFDTTLHREFDESTRSAARQEVYHSFAHLLRDPAGGRLGKLLNSDHVFINGLLATYYGIDGVTGDEFRKVNLASQLPARWPCWAWPRSTPWAATASKAAQSNAAPGSCATCLNDPPPPAPPNVPQLSRLEGPILSPKRENWLAHQEEAQCASCHRKIDPIGFGLENFNAAGKWRTEDSYQLRDKRGRGVGKRKTWTIDPVRSIPQGHCVQRLPRATRPHCGSRRRLRPRLHRAPDRVRVRPTVRLHR